QDPVSVVEPELVIDGPAALVHEPVVAPAEEDEIHELRGAAVRPMTDVVGLDMARRASREAAAAVASLQRTPQRGRDLAGLAADAERLPGTLEQCEDRRVACQAS